MSYLARLKQLESVKNSHYTPDNEPTKPTKGGFDGFVGSIQGYIEKKIIDDGGTASDETAIRAWLTHINETDPEIITEVLDKCQWDAEARAYFLQRTAELPEPGEITRPETLQDRQRETRRQKVIALLEETPDSQRAFYTDAESDPHNVILAIGIRHVATFEMLIDKTKYAPWRLLELIHGQATH